MPGGRRWRASRSRRIPWNTPTTSSHVLTVLRALTGFFDSVSPRLRPRGTPLRMTLILRVLLAQKITLACDAPEDHPPFDVFALAEHRLHICAPPRRRSRFTKNRPPRTLRAP